MQIFQFDRNIIRDALVTGGERASAVVQQLLSASQTLAGSATVRSYIGIIIDAAAETGRAMPTTTLAYVGEDPRNLLQDDIARLLSRFPAESIPGLASEILSEDKDRCFGALQTVEAILSLGEEASLFREAAQERDLHQAVERVLDDEDESISTTAYEIRRVLNGGRQTKN